jgi:hypothetical protein
VVPPTVGVRDDEPFLKPTWLLSAELMQPAFRTAENTVGLGVFAHRRTIPGIAVDEGFGAHVSLTRRLDYRAPISASYRFEHASVEAGDLYFCVNYVICDLATIEAVRGPHRLSPPALAFTSTTATTRWRPRPATGRGSTSSTRRV